MLTPEPPESPDFWNPADFGDAAKRNRGPRRNLTQRTYVVRKGDSPRTIAQACGAVTRPHWLTELEQVNPQKPVDSGIGNWFSLNVGETINLPDAWGAGSVDTGGDEDEAAGPGAHYFSLGEMEAIAPYFAPLAKHFRSTSDPEGFWRGYGEQPRSPFRGRGARRRARKRPSSFPRRGFTWRFPGRRGLSAGAGRPPRS